MFKVTALMILILLGSSYGEDEGYKYTASAQSKWPSMASYELTEYKNHSWVMVGSLDANLYDRPKATGTKIATLDISTEVMILNKIPKRERINQHVNVWYKVEVKKKDSQKLVGYIFGSALSPYVFNKDINGDQKMDIVSITFTEDFRINISFLDSKQTTVPQSLVLASAGEAYVSGKGSIIQAKLLDASVAGEPLIKIESNQEACAEFTTYFISFSHGLKLALQLSGIIDPPVSSTFELSFDSKHKELTENRTEIEESEMKGEDAEPLTKETKIVRSYKLVDGVFVANRSQS